MSTQKEIEKTVGNINDFVDRLYGQAPKIEFDKGNTSTGITHKVFNVSNNGSRKELKREVKSRDLLKWLEGYYQSLQDHVITFRQH